MSKICHGNELKKLDNIFTKSYIIIKKLDNFFEKLTKRKFKLNDIVERCDLHIGPIIQFVDDDMVEIESLFDGSKGCCSLSGCGVRHIKKREQKKLIYIWNKKGFLGLEENYEKQNEKQNESWKKWFSFCWWEYLLSGCVSWRNFFCRITDHKCGVVWFDVNGTEPDMRCKNCGEYLG